MMNGINKWFSGIYILALALCGVGTFLPFHNTSLPQHIHIHDWKLYRYLFVVIILNILFIFTKKHIKLYCFMSIVLIEIFMIVFKYYSYIFVQSSIITEITCYILILISSFMLIKPNLKVAFLINYIIIFVYVNLLGLYYYSFFSSYRYEPLELIIKNGKDIFTYRGVGYFMSNTGIIIAIVSVFINIGLSFADRLTKKK